MKSNPTNATPFERYQFILMDIQFTIRDKQHEKK